MKYFLPCLFCLLLSLQAQAQKRQEDVLSLQNGWVLRGKIIAQNESQVSIETHERQLFVFPIAEVLSISKADYQPPQSTFYKERGFSHYTELGALAARNTSDANVNTSAFSFQLVNGYKFNQYLYMGIGTGIDLYATQSFVPLFASLRGDILRKGTLIPYYFVDAGYGFNATRNDNPDLRFIGGELFAAGLGLKVLFSNQTSFLVSVGYRLQNSATETHLASEKLRQNLNYERLALRAGFSF